MNTPVQTYAGLASMLDDRLRDDHPVARFPAEGFEFTEPNNKDFAPRLGATYRLGEKTVVRAGYGIYYNPNQMNSFTFLTNNPPTRRGDDLHLGSGQPDAVVHAARPASAGPIGRPDMISPTRELPNARKGQWSFDLQREARRRAWRSTCSTSARTPRTSTAASSTTRRSPAPACVDARRPSRAIRSRRIIQNDLIADYDAVSFILRKRMSDGLQVDAHYTWSRTRDMATHSNGGGADDGQLRHPMRDYGPANWDVPHRFVASYIYDIPFLKTSRTRSCATSWPAGRSPA